MELGERYYFVQQGQKRPCTVTQLTYAYGYAVLTDDNSGENYYCDLIDDCNEQGFERR